MRKRRERQRGKHAPASSRDGEPEEVDDEDGSEDVSASVVVAADELQPDATAPVTAASDLAPSDAPASDTVTADTPEPEPVVPSKDSELVEASRLSEAAQTAESPEPDTTVVGPEAAQPATPAAASATDLDALGKILEQSLTGGGEGPLPTVLPPQISATPEDILGVPTHHTAMQELQQQAVKDETDPAEKEAVTLPGSGGGAAPMEAFEERAQMAKEVLRATSSQPSHVSVPVSGETSQPQGDQPEQPDEREEDVRFSEDLTISVKRRRKLFGR